MEKIITLMASVIGVCVTIYKIGFKKDRGRLEAYYNKILKPFICVYHKNSNINAVKYLKPILKREDDDIPKYVFYLVDKKMSEKLKAVLLYDYAEIYKNESNTMSRVLKGFSRVLCYLEFFISIFFVVLGAMLLVLSSYNVLLYVVSHINGDIIWFVLIEDNMREFMNIASAFVSWLLGAFVLRIAKWMNTDTYTLEEKRIKRIIEKKEKIYNKRRKGFYF